MPMRNGKGRAHWPIEQSTVRTWSLLAMVPVLVSLLAAAFYAGIKLNSIETQLADAARDRFDRADMAEWCYTTSVRNADFTCVNPYELPSFRMREGRFSALRPRPFVSTP